MLDCGDISATELTPLGDVDTDCEAKEDEKLAMVDEAREKAAENARFAAFLASGAWSTN